MVRISRTLWGFRVETSKGIGDVHILTLLRWKRAAGKKLIFLGLQWFQGRLEHGSTLQARPTTGKTDACLGCGRGLGS